MARHSRPAPNPSFEKKNGKWASRTRRPPCAGACARFTACKGLWTMRSWTRSCASVRPARRGIRSRRQWATKTLESFSANFAKWLRGDVRVKDDRAVTPSDIADYNLILFGDPGSNSVIAKVIGKLPIRWTRTEIAVGTRDVRRRRSHSGPDLSEPAQSEALRGDQQRSHVRRRGFPRHQRVALSAARRLLGADSRTATSRCRASSTRLAAQ